MILIILVVTAGGGVYIYRQLNGNLTQAALDTGTGTAAKKEKPDPFGRVPINILVIGSDTRSSKADCKLGGDCHGGPGANADVEMVVHVSADRTNMSVMSVPRDLVTNLPGCSNPATGLAIGPRYAQINSSLTYGPGCTVAAVQQLTGIPIDHFVMVDFAGVISMSDSVGGVQICVTNNVFDTYSHLKLSRGKHVLKGQAALEFVRSRHGFGDGSDLGRTYAQHAFLSAVVRSLKRKGVLLNPVAVLGLAQAATKALTVDPGLGSISKLLGLAKDVNQVPTDRITFATMETLPDPQDLDRVVIGPSAAGLFQLIANDQALSTPHKVKGAPTATPTPAPTLPPGLSKVAVRVRNDSGVTGRGTELAHILVGKGFSKRTNVGTSTIQAHTAIYYGLGQLTHAQAVAQVFKLPSTDLHSSAVAGVSLVIGTDWLTGTTFPHAGVASAASRKAALAKSHQQNATSAACVPVSTQRTVTYNGIPMTPIQAFSDSPSVKVSAP